MAHEALVAYLQAVEAKLKAGGAKEHAYRGAFEELLKAYGGAGVDVLNDSVRNMAGAPDFVVRRKGQALGYVETKDIGVDLNKTEKSEQFRRYLHGLSNLILTDYLELRWYRAGEPHLKVSLGTPDARGRVRYKTEDLAQADTLLSTFMQAEPERIGRAKPLAVRLAAKARLIHEAIRDALAQDLAAGNGNSALRQQMLGFREVLLHDLSEDDFANMYAQTIVYGMFAAKENHRSSDFTARSAAHDLPRTNPLLRSMFDNIAGIDLDERIQWIVDDLVELLNLADFGEVLKEFQLFRGVEGPALDWVVHFYETFLKEYDPQERKLRGQYYTPEPVIHYIVRSVDALLKRHFGVPAGLADHAKVPPAAPGGEAVHRVQILDPATGTGSFLFGVTDHIYSALRAEGRGGQWPAYVHEHLLPRLHGFELQMAPYTIAHMKLGLLLKSTGYDFQARERLRIYLTNTLEEPTERLAYPLFEQRLVEEAQQARAVKKDLPILVVLGNPPYAGHSANKGEWIGNLLRGREAGAVDVNRSYYHVDGQPLGERNPKWLQDDYVKFLRWAQWRIGRTGQGIVAMITNHGYLDNPTFRGMRESLLREFDLVYVYDLHGNSKKKERVPEAAQHALEIGAEDKNVFDIQQGVAICLLVKLPPGSTPVPGGDSATARDGRAPADILADTAVHPTGDKAGGQGRPPHQDDCPPQQDGDKNVAATASGGTGAAATGRVFHADLWGLRERKYGVLENGGLEQTAWREINPQAPAYLFVPQGDELRAEYERGCSITTLHSKHVLGITSGNDTQRVCMAQEDVLKLARSERIEPINVRSLLYRPFDSRFTLFDARFLTRARYTIMQHIGNNENMALISTRAIAIDGIWTSALVSKSIIQLHTLTLKEVNSIFPLYLYPVKPDDPRTDAPGGRRPNLSPEFIAACEAAWGLAFIINGKGDLGSGSGGPRAADLSSRGTGVTARSEDVGAAHGRPAGGPWPAPTKSGQGRPPSSENGTFGPEDVFHYMYAVFHAPSYRTRYSEFLKRDFPRLPLTGDLELLRGLCRLGEQLTRLHLLEPSAVDTSRFKLPGYPVRPNEQPPGRDAAGGLLQGEMNLHLGGGGDTVDKVRYTPPTVGAALVRPAGATSGAPTGKVWINAYQYFEGVAPEVWEFRVGGYQPCEKWLKDRKGRQLTLDDQDHYRLVVAILAQTIWLMGEIDALIAAHGGWPLA